MPRKKTSKKNDGKSLVKVIGTPTMMLLPARNYKFKVYQKNYSIKIPRKGIYKDLDDRVFSENDGGFNILEYLEDSDIYTIYMPAISKVLFAVSQYPDLKDNQAFTPLAIIVREDEVEIVGNIIEMLLKEKDDE